MKPLYNYTYLAQLWLAEHGFDPGTPDGRDGKDTQAAFAKALPTLKTVPEPGPTFKVNDRALSLIKHFESCLRPLGDGRFISYPDPGPRGWSLPTIGWGTVQYPNGTKVKKGDIITQAQADEYLAWEVGEKAEGVADMVKVPLNDDQFGALVSFAYNVGTGALKTSTLLRYLNAGDYTGAAGQFGSWVKSDGQVLAGLIRRRKSERNLFLGKTPFIVEA